MSFLEQNAMETLIRRQVDQLFAQQYLAKASASARIQKANAVVVPVAAGGNVVVAFDLEAYDLDNMWDVAIPTRLTIRTAGTYVVVANCTWQPVAAHPASTAIRYNGGPSAMGGSYISTHAGAYTNSAASDVQRLAVNDVIEVLASNVDPAAGVTLPLYASTLVAVRVG